MRALPLFLLLAACGADTPADLDAVSSEVRPTKRSEILPVADPATNSIVVFGGNDGPIVSQVPTGSFLDQTWIFEPGVGWREASGGDTRPRARGRYAVGLDDAGRRMLMFGGRFRRQGEMGDYRLFNDLWAYDLDEHTWTQLDDGRGAAPDGRYYPGGAWDADAATFYVWGGATNENALDIQPAADLWAWTADGGWTEVATMGEPPSRRAFFTTLHDTKRNRLVLFAGQPGDFVSLAFNDLYALDLDTFTWEQLDDGSGRAPSTRMHAHLAYDATRDRYLLFGGHTDIGDANDLWTFDLEGNAWERIQRGDRFTDSGLGCAGNPSEVPADYVIEDPTSPERRHRGMFALLHDNAWLFGGIHAECSDQLDDTWRYDLATDTWHELIEARTGESCQRRGDDCTCMCL